MKFIGNNASNGGFLSDCLPSEQEAEEISEVNAAIAYGKEFLNFPGLLENCLSHNLRLNIWMRYDDGVPVSVSLLKKIYKNKDKNVFCKLVPDVFHSKVIWWIGYGAYIGSANLTERAWIKNIEAGLFISQSELEEYGVDKELKIFFNRLNVPEVHDLNEEIIKEMEMRKINEGPPKAIARKIPVWEGENYISSSDRNKMNQEYLSQFIKERVETNNSLIYIATKLSESNRPVWIKEGVPISWQTDQFLHAYYYAIVGNKNRAFESFHLKNRGDPNKALIDAINWWSNTKEKLTWEDLTLHESAPLIQKYLRKESVLLLTKEELNEVFMATHAIPHHIKQVSSSRFGSTATTLEAKVEDFTNWVYSFKNKKSQNLKEVIYYLLYGGPDRDIWQRLYQVSDSSDDWRIPEIGLNSFGELIGWARPEISVPRNGRTNKSLRALGYDIRE